MSLRRRLAAAMLATLAVACSQDPAAQPAESRSGPIDALREQILASLALEPGLIVAEIGVGGGWFVTRVAEAIGPTGVVYGTDIDPAALAFVQGKVPGFRQPAGRVDLRLCRDVRDTALDDLPADHVDIVLMVDSLCFDATEPRERNVEYLRRFLRILRPGGRFVHHMDCQCDAAPESVVALFADAGFSPRVETVDVPPVPPDPSWPCRTEVQRRRHGFVAVFRKSGAGADEGARPGAAGP